MTGKAVARDCGQLYLCQVSLVCTCTATGCTVPSADVVMGGILFDVSVSGDDMSGSITGGLGEHPIRLTRVK